MQTGYRERLIEYILQQASPPDKFSHQPRLYHLAVRLAGNSEFDDDVLFAAAWLHDLGVFVGHRPEDPVALASWDHIAYVVAKAPAVLDEFGFPEAKIPAVLDAIRTHMPRHEPRTFEATLLRDADILEQLGAVSILRTVSKVGRDTRFIRFGDALRVLRANDDTLPGLLKLESARELAAERVRVLRDFLAAADAEANGIDW